MITVSASVDLSRFNSVFARYMEQTSKLPDQVLEKKGRDLGIQLFKAFVSKKWGGPGKHPGIAKAALAARTAQGKGTKVRASLMAQYISERKALNKTRRSVGQQLRRFGGTLNQWSNLKQQSKDANTARASLWRKTVGKEINLRQSGIGALAASFLWYRTRSSNAKGKYLVKNRNGVAIGFADRGGGFFHIVSDADGTALVDSRYGLVDRALAGLTADMLTYFRERHANVYEQVFNEMMAIK